MAIKNCSKKRKTGRTSSVAKNPYSLTIGRIQNSRWNSLQRILHKIPLVEILTLLNTATIIWLIIRYRVLTEIIINCAYAILKILKILGYQKSLI